MNLFIAEFIDGVADADAFAFVPCLKATLHNDDYVTMLEIEVIEDVFDEKLIKEETIALLKNYAYPLLWPYDSKNAGEELAYNLTHNLKKGETSYGKGSLTVSEVRPRETGGSRFNLVLRSLILSRPELKVSQVNSFKRQRSL